MSRIDHFEELIAWQKARILTKCVYSMTRKSGFKEDYGLTRQIQRAAVSIMSNIAEGFERGGRSEFHQFLSTAKASCAEVRTQLYIALDAEYINDSEFNQTMNLAQEVGRIIGGLRVAVQKQKMKHHGNGVSQSSALSPQS